MTDTTTQTQTPSATDAHEELYVKLEGEPVVKLRKIAPDGTSKLAKPELVRRIVEEREEEARALIGLPLPEKVEPGKPQKLTLAQKHALGDLIVTAAADVLDKLPDGIDRDLAAAQIGAWFIYQPRSIVVDAQGNKTKFWDERLPYDPPKSWRER